MFNLIQKYMTYGLLIVLAIVSTYCGILYLKCGRQEAKIAQLSVNLDTALTANDEGVETIKQLKAERTRATRSCETRLAGYDATLEELMRINELHGGNHAEGNETVVDGNPVIFSGDALLDMLNGMFPDLRGAEGGNKNGICQAGGSGNAKGAEVLSGSVPQYCFCSEQDVKNLLKNQVLRSGRESALVTIIEGLK